MSTRAMYTIKGNEVSGSPHDFNIYKHHDGYPSGALTTIKDTLEYYAWELPRYESDEFAAAFCAAGKTHSILRVLDGSLSKKLYETLNTKYAKGGGVRLMPDGDPQKVAAQNCADIEYRYEIWFDGHLQIKCFNVTDGFDKYAEAQAFSGTWVEFQQWVKAEKKASA